MGLMTVKVSTLHFDENLFYILIEKHDACGIALVLPGGATDQLKYTALDIIEYEYCRDCEGFLEDEVKPGMICAGKCGEDHEHNTCYVSTNQAETIDLGLEIKPQRLNKYFSR